MFAFDECTPPVADYKYVKKSLERTHRWAKICLDAKNTKTGLPAGRQALYGIIQGGKFKDLRIEECEIYRQIAVRRFRNRRRRGR